MARDVLELDAQARLLVPIGIRHHLGCRGYEWAYAEGLAGALEVTPEAVERSP